MQIYLNQGAITKRSTRRKLDRLVVGRQLQGTVDQYPVLRDIERTGNGGRIQRVVVGEKRNHRILRNVGKAVSRAHGDDLRGGARDVGGSGVLALERYQAVPGEVLHPGGDDDGNRR